MDSTAQNAGFLLKELRPKKRAVFILRPTNVRIWHKAVFKVGPVAGPKPNTRGSSKNASDPVGIPLFGAPQAPGDKPNPSEEGLSLGGRPPEARGDVSSGGTHPNRLCSSQPQPVESAPPQDTKQHRPKKRAVFILRPTNVRIWHKAVFKVGPVAGPKPNTRGSSKNASDPVGIPLFGAPQAPGDKPNPSEEGLSLGGRPPEARGDVSSGGTHPNRLCSSQPQPVESAPPQDTKQHRPKKRAVFILRPTNVRIWHKAVFKVGPVAGPKPNTRGSSKNASDPVGIPLFGAPQAPGDKPNPSEEG